MVYYVQYQVISLSETDGYTGVMRRVLKSYMKTYYTNNDTNTCHSTPRESRYSLGGLWNRTLTRVALLKNRWKGS